MQTELADRAVERLLAMRARTMRVAMPIWTRNHDLCGEAVAPYLGLAVARLGRGKLSVLEQAWRRFGLAQGVSTVIVAVEDSPAARAGIQTGDRLLTINGRKMRSYEDLLKHPAKGGGSRPRVRIRAAGVEREIFLDLVPACRFQTLPSLSDELATWTIEGRYLVVPVGLLELLDDDDELAIMIAHELAHRLLDPKSKDDFEHELAADRLGLVLAARAGFKVGGAIELWQRVAIERPAAIADEWHDGQKVRRRLPHGRIAERLLVMPEAIAAARAARVENAKLVP